MKYTYVECGYHYDGTYWVISKVNATGCYVVREEDIPEKFDLVFTGTYEECKAYTERRWRETAESRIG